MKLFEPKLLAALREDLGKPPFEAYASELGVVYEEIRELRTHLESWMSPRAVRGPLTQFPAAALRPARAARCGSHDVAVELSGTADAGTSGRRAGRGNCAVVKPSRYAAKPPPFSRKCCTTPFRPAW